MAGTTKEILAKLKLDSKEFAGKLDEGTKGVLKFTAAVTAISGAVLAATKMTANYRDETIKAARAAGSTAGDFSALRHAADLSGVSMEQLAKGLRRINDPSKEAREEMTRLGISMRDSSGHMKTQNEILFELADKISGLESPAQRSAAAVKIFGTRNADMVNLLREGSSGLREMTAEAERMGLTFSDKAGAASELFNDNIQRLTGSVKGCVMTFTEGIIEFVNTTGIMETLSGAIQGVTGWWKGLDDSTKNMVITVGAIVSGVAALVLAIAGVIAIAPAVGAAITVMTGGLNLVVLAVAAAIAAFAAIAYGAATNWDQVKTAIMPAVESIREAIGDLTSAFKPLMSAFSSLSLGDTFSGLVDSFKSWLGITDESIAKMSILGTIAKVVFAGIGSAIIIVIGVFQLLNNTIQLIGTSIEALGVAFYQAIVNQNFDAAKAALSRIGDAAQKLKDDFVGIGDKIKQSFSNIVVTVDAKEAAKNIKDFKNDVSAAEAAASRFSKEISRGLAESAQLMGENAVGIQKFNAEFLKALSKISEFSEKLIGIDKELEKGGLSKFDATLLKVSLGFQLVANVAASALKAVSAFITEGITSGLERTTRYMDLYTGLYSNMMDKQIADTTAAEDEKIALMNEKYDEQIKALEDAEAQKNAIIEFAGNERLLLLDAEYQAAREKAEEEYALWVENEQIKYEADKEMMLQKSIDKEQGMLVEEIMDNDFKLYLESKQTAHDAFMNQLAADYATRTKTETASLKTAQAALETASAAEIKAITEQKNADATAAEADKNAKLKALEDKRASDEKNMKKLQVLMNWKAEQAMFDQTKGMKIADVLITGIAGAAMAFAMAAGSIPIYGLIVGAVLMAAVLAMTFASIGQLASQQSPPVPVSVFLASGGVMAGPSHAEGGISANLEGGEGVLDKARTEKFIDSIDGATSKGVTIQNVFEPGSIVNNGKEVDDSLIDMIASALARKLERQGVYAT
jgi:hypothetical protein